MKIIRRQMLKPGQSLTTVLIFVIIALTITSSAIVITLTNSFATSKFDLGSEAFYAAEAGMENAILRLLRDPSYSGETMQIGQDAVEIAVTGSNPYTITSTGRSVDFVRKIQTTVSYANNILTVTSWKEVH